MIEEQSTFSLSKELIQDMIATYGKEYAIEQLSWGAKVWIEELINKVWIEELIKEVEAETNGN